MKKSARVPAFSRVSRLTAGVKHWYKKIRARRNRRHLHQAIDPQEHRDEPLNSWDID